MNGQRGEFQHARADEWQERDLYDGHQQYDHGQHHRLHQCQHEQNDMYSVYTSQNNLGVMLLREKRYLDAANCFCQAVKYVNERSMYNCYQSSDDSQSASCVHRNYNEDCHDYRQSESPSPTPSVWDGNDSFDIDESSTTSSIGSDSDSEYAPSSSNRIDSFYLLLDEDTGNTTDDTSRSHQPPCKESCSSGGQSASMTFGLSNQRKTNFSSNSSQQEGTFVFRNPIIVSKREDSSTTGLSTLGTATASSSPRTTTANASEAAAAMPRRPSMGSNTENTIDKETCAKLSLLSVYNMALTYHLAALDTDKSGGTESYDARCLDNKKSPSPKFKDVVKRNLDSANGFRTDHGTTTTDSSSCDYTRPAKRQRLSNRRENNSSGSLPATATTTTTPFGTCNNPYQDRKSSSTSNHNNPIDSAHSATSNNCSVDRVLLGQALSYYEIAYRILVSEHRVLVSQAMVILNNIGHIHRLMGREDEAKSCFQRLLTTMIYLQQTGESHQISHWESFMTNVMDLIVPPECSHKKFAPAA